MRAEHTNLSKKKMLYTLQILFITNITGTIKFIIIYYLNYKNAIIHNVIEI